MKQFAILFAAVCAMTFMTGQEAQAQCGGGGYGGYGGGFGRGVSVSVGRGFGGGFGGYSSGFRGGSVYRPVYGSSFNRGFGGFSRGYGGFSRGGFRY